MPVCIARELIAQTVWVGKVTKLAALSIIPAQRRANEFTEKNMPMPNVTNRLP
jgi:hypothetical protein